MPTSSLLFAIFAAQKSPSVDHAAERAGGSPRGEGALDYATGALRKKIAMKWSVFPCTPACRPCEFIDATEAANNNKPDGNRPGGLVPELLLFCCIRDYIIIGDDRRRMTTTMSWYNSAHYGDTINSNFSLDGLIYSDRTRDRPGKQVIAPVNPF